jgi:hypothetical protein
MSHISIAAMEERNSHPLDVMIFNYVASGAINDIDVYLSAYGSHEEAINAQINDCIQFIVRESLVEFVDEMIPNVAKNGVPWKKVREALIGAMEGYIDAYEDGE